MMSILFTVTAATALLAVSAQAQPNQPPFRPEIPKTWEDSAIESLQVPLANPGYSPVPISADYYYKLPVRPIYKSYPIYHPSKQPAGYMEWLRSQGPQIVSLDFASFRTREEWIRAGEVAFDAPTGYEGAGNAQQFGDAAYYKRIGLALAKDGTVPYTRYVIREKGKVEAGSFSCSMCHTRLMPDGTALKGAQGNYPFDRSFGGIEGLPEPVVEQLTATLRPLFRLLYDVPWLDPPEPSMRFETMSLKEITDRQWVIPPGVNARHGTGLHSPAQIPDLIGVRERRYLDKTGLVRHRRIADLMRYAALNQAADLFSRYGTFIPGADDFRSLPEPGKGSPFANGRYSDEQLYALGLFIYSLEPPPNPNKPDARTNRGKRVFERAGCAGCHPPPLYTNNKLTPVAGFTVPEDHKSRFDILPVVVGTDPTLALKTRRGTGYYKVPSLKGVWYRGPIEHNGSVATLEDWFDPRRLREDYVPTGFVGYGVKARAVRGHEFGLSLSQEEKTALIAFLRTL